MSTFLQTDNHSWSCRTSILEGAIFHKMSYCKFLWGNPSLELLPLGLRVLDDFSLILLHERIRRRIWWCNFSALIDMVAETCLLSHTARGFPIANNLQEFFVHAVLFPDSWPRRSSHNFQFWPKVLISNILLDTSLHHSFQSVIIRSQLLLMNLQVIQFQHGLEFIRLSYSEFVQSFQDVIKWDFRHRQ